METVLVRRMSIRCVLVLALMAALSACHDSTGPSGTYSGIWHLRTINGQSLPFDFGGGDVELSETITIQNDGSFASDDRYTVSGQPLVQSLQGSCTLKAPTQLVCTAPSGYGYGFVWQGDSLYTAPPAGFAFVYRR